VYGDRPPPFDPRVIAGQLKVHEISFGPIGKDALLIPVDNGFEVKISSELPRSRQRFALAHELGHSLFFNTDGSRPLRPYSRDESDEPEERLCNIFAGEILVPEYSLREIIQNAKEPKLEILLNLARVFNVSVQCLAIRVAESQLWNAAVVNWSPDHSEVTSLPTGGVVPKLRVNWAATPKGYFIPMHDSAKIYSVVYSCYLDGEPANADEVLSLGTLRGRYHISCVRVRDVADSGCSVLSLVNLKS
jgi:hypothetical protein